jgi:polyisoprenyl-phosphate glycosyltransferase
MRRDWVVAEVGRASRLERAVCLAIVVPCFNESEILGLTIPSILRLLEALVRDSHCTEDSYVVLVDDGSKDDTWRLIEEAARSDSRRVRGVRLASNVGHQGALLCGLDDVTGRCDVAVSIDADLQDDLAAIPKMLSKYREGAELVLGVRETREVDTWFKRNTALYFYRLMRWIGVNLVENHADFRLMSDRALRNLQQFTEYNLFLRALPPFLHRNVATVSYARAERVAGETKYTLGKMLGLAWSGITSFSVAPLRLISAIGALVFLASLGLVAFAVLGVINHRTLPGWASVVIPLYLLGGLLMLSIGVVGEYVGKLFMEVKRRPRYLVDDRVGAGEQTKDVDV